MAFELRERDLAGRIGKLVTKSGEIETPALLPVIDPKSLVIQPSEILSKYNCNAIITNAYIVKKNFEKEAVEKGVHRLLNFPGVVMTDSGAYQLLVYKKVDISPEEAIRFQEKINSDIAVILDVPTGSSSDKSYAKWTVEETLARAEKAFSVIVNKSILWVGPVQGGKHLDLIKYSAIKLSRLPFDIYALGSPTQIMESYMFDQLVDMIITAKSYLPLDKPFHLFGAGHPLIFSLIVGLGCDLFDSAAYAIYAYEKRYMTERGTIKLSSLKQLPCSCPVCYKLDAEDLKELSENELIGKLAEHNLYVCFRELKAVKQAIYEGRLWELIEARASSHPKLLMAFKRLEKYVSFLERYTPLSKNRGLFLSASTTRPEVYRHVRRILHNFKPADALLLIPPTREKPFHKSRKIKKLLKLLKMRGVDNLDICVYSAPLHIVPLMLDEVFPLSQFETSEYAITAKNIEVIELFIRHHKYRRVIIYGREPALDELAERVAGFTDVKYIKTDKLWSGESLAEILKELEEGEDAR